MIIAIYQKGPDQVVVTNKSSVRLTIGSIEFQLYYLVRLTKETINPSHISTLNLGSIRLIIGLRHHGHNRNQIQRIALPDTRFSPVFS